MKMSTLDKTSRQRNRSVAKEQVKIRIAGKTDTGMLRQHNEDFIGFEEDTGLAVLADGLGGRAAGEVASCMAATSILTELRPGLPPNPDSKGVFGDLLEAISAANLRIFNAANANKCHRGMSTTVVAVRIEGRRLFGGCVGDSRLYLLRNKRLEQLSSDHTLVNEIAKGKVSGETFSLKNLDHILTRALGIHSEVEIERLEHELRSGDLLMLCSDGLWDMVADWQIKDILTDLGHDLDRCAARLVDSANLNGGKDNISVVLARID